MMSGCCQNSECPLEVCKQKGGDVAVRMCQQAASVRAKKLGNPLHHAHLFKDPLTASINIYAHVYLIQALDRRVLCENVQEL